MKENVMIVEDEFITAMDIQQNLEKFGLNVIGISRSGEEAINMAKNFSPDLILMDIALAGKIDGTQAAQEITETRVVPIIFITAYNDPDTFNKAKRCNPYGYLTKPFDHRDLAIAVELALLKHKKEIESTSHLIHTHNEFLENMTHEILKPLKVLIKLSELLYFKKEDNLSDSQINTLEKILSYSRHLLQLTNNILDLAKISLGKIKFFPELFDINTLFNDVIENMKTFMPEKFISFSASIDEKLYKIKIDPLRLKQLLYHYLSTAIKLSQKHSTIEISIEIKNENFFCISVKEKELTLSKETSKDIFTPFKPRNQSFNDFNPDIHLNLAIVKRLVEAQGGKAGIETNLQKGYQFFAILPRIYPMPMKRQSENV